MPKYEVAATCVEVIHGPQVLGIATFDTIEEAEAWIQNQAKEWRRERGICESDDDYDPIEIGGNLSISAHCNETIFIGAWKLHQP